MGELPSGTVTFLFTDVEGSTRLLARLRHRYVDVLAEHQRLLRAAFDGHSGHEVHTEGDAFFVAFARASDAIAAAVGGQRALCSQRWPEGAEVRVRMGIHTGEAVIREDDYVGLDVHRAARICSAGHGGQVLISSSTHELVVDAIGPDLALRDLGEHRLKSLDRPEHLFQLIAAGLPTEFPRLGSLPAGPPGANGLPRVPNRTIGRQDDIRAIADRLGAGGVRLLTLTGHGGVGKTRLALEAARAVEADFDDGACFVSLAALTAAKDVPGAIVQALGIVSVAGETSEQAVIRFLSVRHVLLVLDNLEHLLGAAPFVAEVLTACPALTVVTTSREPLLLAIEECYPVKPLELPPAGSEYERIDRAPAVALFAERARARDPAFAMTPASAIAVAEICRRLDGLPLAIELAAARCSVLSPAEIAQRLDSALATLGRAPRDAPARQRTLRATIDWSFALLDQPARDAFTGFAVFVGGATVEAAEAITDATLDTLEQLVSKSLIVRQDTPTTTRLSMLETVRAYAVERLAASAVEPVLHDRHYQRYLAHARGHGNERALWGTDSKEHLALLDAESDNLHAALRWAVDQSSREQAVAMVAALGRYWLMRDRYADAVQWIDQALAAPTGEADPNHVVNALCIKGLALHPLGRQREDAAVFAEAEAVARQAGDPVLLSRVLSAHAGRETAREELDLADALADKALELATVAEDAWALGLAAFSKAMAARTIEQLRVRVDQATALLDQVDNVYLHADLLAAAAYAAMCLGGDRDAKQFVERAIPHVRRLDAPYQWMLLRGNFGLAALLTGDLDAADEAFHEELMLCRELAVLPFAAEALTGLGAVASSRGDADRAARLVGAATPYRFGEPKDPLQSRLDTLVFEPARERRGREAWDATVRDGAALGFEEAVAYALEEPPA